MAGTKETKDLYFLVEGIKYEDVAEMCNDHLNMLKSNKGLQCISIHAKIKPLGKEVVINNQHIVLFKHRGLMYAMDSQCPHMGGPLYLGDIEELGESKVPCIVCPWHHWKYDIDSGDLMWPLHGNVKVAVYPVKVTEDGSLFVGFKSISPDYFNCAEKF